MILKSALMAGLAVLAVGTARAADGPGAVAPEVQTFTLGGLKLVALHDGRFIAPNNAQTFGVDAGPAAVAAILAKAGAPTDKITVSVNVLVVITPRHVALLDTGLGPRAGGVLQASLAQAGIGANSVTDVLITHTHGDHIGGLINAAGGSAFPKAVIRMSTKEWAWAKSQDPTLVKAIGSQVKTFEPGTPVLPAITAIAIDGHTPGHVGYEISSGGAKLLDIGDTAHSSIISLAKPDWTMGFDGNAALSKASRRATLTRLAKSHELVFAPHFPFPGVGRVEKDGDGFTWKPALK
jgi:glyoxylase-like metal-dependent hydrolase (beta-lactamase superfamily II)